MRRNPSRAFVALLLLQPSLALAEDAPAAAATATPEPPPAPPPEASEPAPEPAPTPTPEPAPEPAPSPAPAPEAATAQPAPLEPFPAAGAPAAPPPPTASFEPPAPVAAGVAPAPASNAAPSPAGDGPPVEKKDDRDGVLGPFRIGPVIGVGLPSLINVGGIIKLTPYFAAGVDIGVAPSVNIPYFGEATVSYHAYEAYAHIHPFGGGLYLGAALGYALASGTAEETVNVSTPAGSIRGTLRSEGSVQTLVLTPELGYFYTFKSGFSLGVGAGLQIPVAASEIEYVQNVDSPLGEVAEEYLDPTRRQVEDSLEKVGQTPLPTVGVSIGWLL